MIRRAPRPAANYLIIRNDVARDGRLSYRARGILIAVLSRPDNWKTTSEALAKESIEGRDAVRTALRELEALGYIVRYRYRGADGRWVWEAIVYDVSQSPAPGNPSVDNQASVTQSSKEVPSRRTEEEETTGVAPESQEVTEVWESWLASTGRDASRTKLDSKRRARILWALKHYPKDDVLDAVRGWENSRFHRGENERKRQYNDVTLLFRDASHLEMFRDLARSKTESGANQPASWAVLQAMAEEE